MDGSRLIKKHSRAYIYTYIACSRDDVNDDVNDDEW